MRKSILLIFCVFSSLLVSSTLTSQVHYKQMMYDPGYNFYEVCEAADLYFQTHDKGKGSGWKPYQRWKAENESKYYPTGVRDHIDPLFLANAYSSFQEQINHTSRTQNPNWRDLGPYNANNITEGYNPGIGRVESFWVNPNNTQHLLLGSRSGGFWRSLNGGIAWQNTTDTLLASGVNTIAVNPFNIDSILINVRNASNGTSHGVYRSVDGGTNWEESNFNPLTLGWGGLGSNGQVYKIAYHPRVSDLVFIGTNNGMYRSDDDLQTWTQLLTTGDITDIEFHPTNDSIIYVYDNYYWSATKNNILISTDQGLSYNSSATITGNNSSKGFIAVSPVAPNYVYFASTNGVWKSSDTGQNFTFLSTPTENCDGFSVSDIDTSNMVYGYLNLMGSTDGGVTFIEIASWSNRNPTDDYTHADLRTAECINGTFYVGTDGYLSKTDDNGMTWDRLNDGTGIREFYAAGVSQGVHNVFIAGSQDNGTSILDEDGWLEWNGGDGMEAIVQTLNPDWMMGSWQYGTRQFTRDGGVSRTGSGNPEAGSGNWQAPMFYDPLHQMKVYSFADSIWQSDDFGENWSLLGVPDLGTIVCASIAENNSNIMAISSGDKLKISEDGGLTFRFADVGLPNSSIKDIAFDPNFDSTLVVVFNTYSSNSQKVFISSDLGVSWTNISNNLNDMPILTVVIDHSDERNIYLGAEIGVYVKAMKDSIWERYAEGLPNVAVKDLEIQYGSNTLKAATWGRGLWEVPLLDRATYPTILQTKISNAPSTTRPRSGYAEDVTAVISYAQSLKAVFVKWANDSIDLYKTINMSNVSDSTWKTDESFTLYSEGTQMYFKVFAVGQNNDTTETYRFHYAVRSGLPVTSIIENTFESDVRLFPNPNSGEFQVDLGASFDNVIIEIMDVTGKRVYSKVLSGNNIPISLDAVNGVYFLNVRTKKHAAKIKFVVD